MDSPSLLPIYDRLKQKYDIVKYKKPNYIELAAKINSILMGLPKKESKLVGETIYALILHHSELNGSIKGETIMGGVKLPLGKGIQYTIIKLPPILQQIISIFVEELLSGTCPESSNDL